MNYVVGNMKTAVASRISSRKSKHEASRFAGGSKFSVMALQTIGGSSVPSKTRNKSCANEMGSGGVQVQRSWRVESNSRSVIFSLDDAESDEEHILGGIVMAEVDPDAERRT